MDSTLQQMAPLFSLAKDMEANKKRGQYATLVPGAIGVCSIFFFGLGLRAALLLDLGVMSAALGNAMLPKWVKPRNGMSRNVTLH